VAPRLPLLLLLLLRWPSTLAPLLPPHPLLDPDRCYQAEPDPRRGRRRCCCAGAGWRSSAWWAQMRGGRSPAAARRLRRSC